MKLNRKQVRDELKRLKKQGVGDFRREMNEIHTRAYELAVRHFEEAMNIVLTPKQKHAVVEKATEIRELWDGIHEVTVDETERMSMDGQSQDDNDHSKGI